MNRLSQLARLCCGLTLLLLAGATGLAQDRSIDLHPLGYKPRENYKPVVQQFSPFISVGPLGKVAVGFVTRERLGLATRALPPLSFHVVLFSGQGDLLDQHAFPTSSWIENSIFFGASGELLIRTGERVRLFSPQMELLAERELPPTKDSPIISWKIFRSPDTGDFLFYNFRRDQTSLELLDSRNLARLRACSFDPFERVTAVYDQSISYRVPSPATDPLMRRVTVSKVCGPTQFEYSWHGEPLEGILVGDRGLLLAGASPQIRFIGSGGSEVLWQDFFDKHHDQVTENIQTSANGEILVVAVKSFAGGNKFLDLTPRLKGERLVLYRSP